MNIIISDEAKEQLFMMGGKNIMTIYSEPVTSC